jgi:hypothetical protein
MAIWNVLRTFVIFYEHLVLFVFIWYIFLVLVSCTKKNLASLGLPRRTKTVSRRKIETKIEEETFPTLECRQRPAKFVEIFVLWLQLDFWLIFCVQNNLRQASPAPVTILPR